MLITIALLAVSLILILLAAELFTNSVEWTGHKLRLSTGLVGSVLAAVGTALPETVIPIVAVLPGTANEASEAVGVGAILGAPFMLATLAMFVTGAAAFVFRSRRRSGSNLQIDYRILGRDMRFFFIAYSVAIATAFVPLTEIKIPVVIFLVGLYAYYILKQATEGGEVTVLDHLDTPLHFHRGAENPHLSIVLLQVTAGLGLMIGGARIFIQSTSALAELIGVPALILSLIVAPIATELPEKLNSIIWVRNSKDTFALGNITGAMVFQSCFPVTVGILFTSWSADTLELAGFISASIALASSLTIFVVMMLQKRLPATLLLTGGVWYALYLGYIVSRWL